MTPDDVDHVMHKLWRHVKNGESVAKQLERDLRDARELYRERMVMRGKSGMLARALHEMLYTSSVLAIDRDGTPVRSFVCAESLRSQGCGELMRIKPWLMDGTDANRFLVSRLLREVRDYMEFEATRE